MIKPITFDLAWILKSIKTLKPITPPKCFCCNCFNEDKISSTLFLFYYYYYTNLIYKFLANSILFYVIGIMFMCIDLYATKLYKTIYNSITIELQNNEIKTIKSICFFVRRRDQLIALTLNIMYILFKEKKLKANIKFQQIKNCILVII